MDNIAAAVEQEMVTERMMNKLNAAAQSHLTPVQHHILQQAYFKECAYECPSRRQEYINNCSTPFLRMKWPLFSYFPVAASFYICWLF